MKIGFIGLGIMGEPMCANIINKHDDDVFIFDCVKDKVDLLKEKGGIPCESSVELAKLSDVIITMVPKSEHSKSVYAEIANVLNPSKICIDMSTIEPNISRRIAEMVKKTGALFLDAPVVKSKPAAISGQLGIYVGGDFEMFESIKPILMYMGSNIKYMGENGKGLVMKICHNTLVAQIQNGVNETIALAGKNGISISDFTEAISYGGGQNFYLDSKSSFIEKNDFTTAFSVENMAKDLEICCKLADECFFTMPGMVVTKKVYDKALKQGFGKEDFSATIKIVKRGDI